MLRVPKIILQAKWSVCYSLFKQLLQLFGALQSKMTVFYSTKTSAASIWGEKKQNFLWLYSGDPDQDATALFSVHFVLSPPSPSAECQLSPGLKFFSFFFFFNFNCLIFMLMLFQSCVSGSHCLCLTGRLNVLAFSKNHGHGRWLSCWKEKEESAVFMEWRRV